MRAAGRRAWDVFGPVGALFLLCGIAYAAHSCVQNQSLEQQAYSQTPTTSQREQRVGELRAISEELRAAILAENIETLLKYDRRNAELDKPVPPGRFADEYGFYEADRLLLRNRKSWLYCRLFDTMCARETARKHGGLSNPYLRISIKEFLVTNPTEVRVIFYGNSEGVENLDGAIILYVRSSSGVRLPAVVTPKPEYALPISEWGQEFVGTELERTKQGWRYPGVMFTITTGD